MSGRELAAELAVMVSLAGLIALLGPFGTFAMPLGPRFLAWLVFALGGYIFFRPVIAGGRALAELSALPAWLTIAIACALASLPTTLLVGWALGGMDFGRTTLGALGGVYPQVLLIGGIATAIQIAVQSRRAAAPSVLPPVSPPIDTPAAIVAAAPSFLDRLPPHLGTQLLCLENEDHYVRAHTALGSTLILMRLRDAVAELDGIAGARVHRSWWVARDAVAGIVRRDRAVALRLTDGREVPVARAAAAELRAAGWW